MTASSALKACRTRLSFFKDVCRQHTVYSLWRRYFPVSPTPADEEDSPASSDGDDNSDGEGGRGGSGAGDGLTTLQTSKITSP